MDIRSLQEAFAARFPNSNQPITVTAPGRVNLLGEHTDYNEGFVFPMAINARVTLVGALRSDSQVHLYSVDYQAEDQFDLTDYGLTKENPWSNYIRGVCQMYQRDHDLRGMNIILQGDVPQGAGLSSSAALEIAATLLVRNLHGLNLSPVEMVKLAQRAENEFVGVQCGIMDQFVSMLAEEDKVLFLDCRSLKYELVPVPFADTQVVVIDSSVKRGLVDSEYNKRRTQCEEAVVQLRRRLPKISSLRDVGVEHMPLIEDLPVELMKRARHVVTENQRVLDGIAALRENSPDHFGRLMNESHASLRDDYEVSCPELDLLVELAQATPGVYGSRMTGAGFGGCTVSLVKNDTLPLLEKKIRKEYPEKTGYTPRIFVFSPSAGAYQVED